MENSPTSRNPTNVIEDENPQKNGDGTQKP